MIDLLRNRSDIPCFIVENWLDFVAWLLLIIIETVM